MAPPGSFLVERIEDIGGVDTELRGCVAAFQDENRRQLELPQPGTQLREIVSDQSELRDRVIDEGVETQRDDDGVRAMALDALAGDLQCREPCAGRGACG